MADFWIGLVIGLSAGAILGFFVCAILTAGAEADKDMEQFWKEKDDEK